jgi:hypothetical protein
MTHVKKVNSKPFLSYMRLHFTQSHQNIIDTHRLDTTHAKTEDCSLVCGPLHNLLSCNASTIKEAVAAFTQNYVIPDFPSNAEQLIYFSSVQGGRQQLSNAHVQETVTAN